MDLHSEFLKSRIFHDARIDRRAADALAGLAIGLIADDVVNQAEASFLKSWIESNLVHLHDPVINLLYQRLSMMLNDGVLDVEEAADLLTMLKCFGDVHQPPVECTHRFSQPNSLPFDHPPPEIICPARVFVFTGIMAYGPRSICEELVVRRGGAAASSVTGKTNYLVVGTISNEQWLHTSYGRKIMRAVELKTAGNRLAIISEDTFLDRIFSVPEGEHEYHDEPMADMPLQGQVWVLTGLLESLNRTEATEVLQALGAKVAGSVSKQTTCVVAGPGAGSKLANAQKFGVPVLDEDAFVDVLAQHGVAL